MRKAQAEAQVEAMARPPCPHHGPRAMREFSTGATRDDDTTKPDYEGYLSPAVLVRFSRYMTEHRVQADGNLRASDNWQKGIPRDQYLKSLIRHVIDLWGEHRDRLRDPVRVHLPRDPKVIEDTLCAILFNAQGYLHEWLREGDVRRVIALLEKDAHPWNWKQWLAKETGEAGPHWRQVCREKGESCDPGESCDLYPQYKAYLAQYETFKSQYSSSGNQPGASK